MLSGLIWLPILGSVLVGLWPRPEQARRLALVIALVSLGLCGLMLSQFDPSLAAVQMSQTLSWMPDLGLSYTVGVDGISLPLVVLNTVLVLVAIWGSSTRQRLRLYYALMLLLGGAVTGAFLAQNLILFFLFFEIELIPLYLLIGIWGGPRRGYASVKFLIYTAVAGILLLVGFFGMAFWGDAPGFEYAALEGSTQPLHLQVLLLIPILLGLAIKIPLVPLHTWLPDAHVEASTPVSVMLAGILLKLGTYGLLRFGVQMMPEGWQVVAPWLAALAVINVLYGSLNALAQQDIKKIVAFGSVAHMGYVLLAAAAATPLSMVGAVFQMVSHGLISALLFLLVGAVYANTGTRDLKLLRGLLNPERGLPLVGSLMILGVMASAGTPGMVGFIAEFVVFRSSFEIFPVQTLLCMVGTGLTAAYFLLMVNRAFFGRLSAVAISMPRRTLTERLPAAVLALAVVMFGVQPNWVVRWTEASAAQLGSLVRHEGTFISSLSVLSPSAPFEVEPPPKPLNNRLPSGSGSALWR